jgi:hypothetical protein
MTIDVTGSKGNRVQGWAMNTNERSSNPRPVLDRRSSAIRRLHAMTAGTAIVGAVAIAGFGGLAALTYDGATSAVTADATTTTSTTTTGTTSATTSAASNGLAATGSSVGSSSRTAHASSGGS